jgi:DNA-binding winged helix-turn-helix (wHTH) protein
VLYRFGPFTLDAGSFALQRGDVPVPLPPKLVDLLHYLVARPSALVSKEELFQSLWPDVVVTENALTQAISDLRQALGDDRSRPTYIQTVAKRGYRFVAPVDATGTEPAASRVRPRRETSSLDAYRALMEGRLQLESLDASDVAVAIENFKRAIDLDPSVPGAYVGLANAHFWRYEMSRHRDHPDASLLSLAIEQAECAVTLDAELGEAHATLAYLPIHRHQCAVLDSPCGVLDPDDAGEAEFAGDDCAVRQHAAALDHQARDQTEHRGPSRIGLPGHQHVAT